MRRPPGRGGPGGSGRPLTVIALVCSGPPGPAEVALQHQPAAAEPAAAHEGGRRRGGEGNEGPGRASARLSRGWGRTRALPPEVARGLVPTPSAAGSWGWAGPFRTSGLAPRGRRQASLRFWFLPVPTGPRCGLAGPCCEMRVTTVPSSEGRGGGAMRWDGRALAHGGRSGSSRSGHNRQCRWRQRHPAPWLTTPLELLQVTWSRVRGVGQMPALESGVGHFLPVWSGTHFSASHMAGSGDASGARPLRPPEDGAVRRV